MLKKEDKLLKEINNGAIQGHHYLGPGLIETDYDECLCGEIVYYGDCGL
ncbi:MAG: hypothetical protein HND49_00165 [Planctomycetes bacterium]|nr:hypothetical protein [Planctomycetota bacterium]